MISYGVPSLPSRSLEKWRREWLTIVVCEGPSFADGTYTTQLPFTEERRVTYSSYLRMFDDARKGQGGFALASAGFLKTLTSRGSLPLDKVVGDNCRTVYDTLLDNHPPAQDLAPEAITSKHSRS